MGAKRPTPRHILIKMPKVKGKERIFKAAREKQLVTYSRIPISDWQEILKITKSRDLQLRLLYPVNLSFRIKGQIKSFPHKKKKLKEFIITKPLLYEMLKGLT